MQRTGVFFGQCSELCGANHGFMPIVVESVALPDYTCWLDSKLSEILVRVVFY
jgi:heme/copper-type cytochrome/quinol oxidase subunit 2